MTVGQTTGLRIEALRRELDRYRIGSGALPSALQAIEDSERKVARDRNRIRHIEAQISELTRELDVARQEAEGRMKLLEAVLEQATRDLGIQLDHHWSPTPIFGFRAWEIVDNELVGVKTSWARPTMTAVCLKGAGTVDVPHSDGRCGRLGCGVYAAKSVQHIIRSAQLAPGDEYVLGLVALEGKVVEHELGYRAAKATIVAAAAGIRTMQATTSDEAAISHLCRNPSFVIQHQGEPFDRHVDAIEHAAEYLNNELARRSPWT